MPLYEYQCKSCKKLTERIQKFSDTPLAVCPHCGGELEQLVSAPAVHFKGAGWYVTDYAKKSANSPTSGNGSNEPASSASDDKSKTEDKSKSETKPDAAKSEAATSKEAK